MRIRGFRSLRDLEIPIGPFTILIGPNGSGKSSALEALRLWFFPQREVADDDFWSGSGDTTADEIRIAVTLTDLTPEDMLHYGDFVMSEGALTIERVFLSPGRGTYVATRLARSEFSQIRNLPLGHRDRFNALVDEGTFPGLERARSKDDAFEKMRQWEQDHPDDCEPIPQEVDFLLLDDPEPAAIRRRMRLAFIGALEDPETHVGTRGKGAMVELLESATDFSRLRDEIRQVADEATGRIENTLSTESHAFDEVTAVVSEAMGRFARGYSVNLAWSTPTLAAPSLPEILVSVVDADGLSPGMSRQGHGIQRSLMFGLLTAQAELGTSELPRTVVVAIEEPEAFQHPLSARALARTLNTLSQGSYQVLYSTHSPDLVPAKAVEGMRLFARGPSADRLGKETNVEVFSLDALRSRIGAAVNRADFTNESTLARLRANLDSRVLEGIFSRLVVLVEGEEDEALIRGAAAEAGWDLDDAGISVVQCRGKTSMPLLLGFFLEVGVATYPIFDLDRHNTTEQHSGAEWAETAIRSLLSVTNDGAVEETTVSDALACWREDFGRQVRSEIGDLYDAIEINVCRDLGYAVGQGRKVGPVVHAVLEQCYQAGTRSDSLDQLLATFRSRLSGL